MERYRRCHLRGCQVHYGGRREQTGRGGGGHGRFSPVNRAEMVELHQTDGWSIVAIAEAFGAWPNTVSRILAEERAAQHDPA